VVPNTTRIVPLVSETASAALAIPAYANEELPRLAGLCWGAEDLAAAVGASRKRDAKGMWTPLFQMVRSQTLLAAHARKVAAIDTLHAQFKDLKGLKAAAEAACADGFTGMLAIHPDQVPVINQAFAASDKVVAEARTIVDLFAANPGIGVLQLDGRMIDQPHLQQARRLLESQRG
jgi:citrate lyase subunit beta / citryl-CoA lyase